MVLTHGRTIALAALACAFFGGAANAATIIDLGANDSGSANGAIYEWTNYGPTGTGAMNTFLRVQANGMEQGYNHSLGGNVPWDTKPSIHTHDIQYKDLVTRSVTGVDYYEFLLDINEQANGDRAWLSLDNVQIFTRDSAISSADESLSGLGTERYNSDNGADGDVTVNLDYNRNNGSGSGDMFMLVPVSLFAGTMPDDYVYFYSQLGATHPAGAGFEEWGMRKSVATEGPVPDDAPVPEPGSMLLLGSGLMLAARRLRAA
jgi:hypothetical protein